MRAVIATFFLLLVSSAAVGAPKYPFESVVDFAQTEAIPTHLPAKYARALEFPDAEINVRRLAYTQDVPDTFRAFDIIPDTSDFLLFIRKGRESITFWRVSSSGKIRTTVASGPDWIRVQDNKTYAADYAAIHDFFCSMMRAAKAASIAL